MKILSLKSLNINSLQGITEIDFEALTQQSALFAITGATGSGKSTLFDIITTALYGRTPRLKNPSDLMSRHSGECFCEVEFAVDGKRYRASWSQKRARKKPEGKLQPVKMELTDIQNETIFDLKSRDVPKKVEEISGLDFGRFTQSILLAQGGFDVFLKADEKSRSSFLEEITGTHLYAEISTKVFQMHKEIVYDIETHKQLLGSIALLDTKQYETMQEELRKILLEKEQCDKQIKSFSFMHRTMQKEKKVQIELAQIGQNIVNFEKNILLYKEKVDHSLALFASAQKLYNEQRSSLKKFRELVTQEKDAKKDFTQKEQNIQQKKQIIVSLEERLKEKQAELEKLKQKLQKAEQYDFKEDEKRVEYLQKRYDEEQKEVELLLQTTKKTSQEESMLQEKLQHSHVVLQTFYYYEESKKNRVEFRNELALLQEQQKQNILLQNELQKHIETRKKHIETLRREIEIQQLVAKYEEDRAKLKEGEACFLCGATTHPYKKQSFSVVQESSQILLEDELSLLAQQEKEFYNSLNTLTTIQTKLQGLKESIAKEIQQQEKAEDFLEKNDISVKHESRDSFEATIQQMQQRLVYIKQQHDKKEQLIESLSSQRVKISDAKFTLEEIRKKIIQEIEELKQQHIALRLQMQEYYVRAQTLQEESQNESQLLSQLSSKIRLLQDQKKQILDIQDGDIFEKQIEKEYLQVQQIVQKSKDMLQREKILQDEAKQRQENIVRELKELEKSLTTHRSQTEDQLLEKIAQEEQKRDALQEKIGTIKTELKLEMLHQEKYSKELLLLQEKEKELALWSKLNELIGSADGTKFKKYAQSVTLDQLIYLANEYLIHLSPRYKIKRDDEKLLELLVIDSYQADVSRPVATLSGGESFIVSLALALGLSSLASQKVAIDSLFLDEGFGTLDSQSLDMALNALNLLQSSGKMVGVISHVEALKERIALQIKVVSNGDGTSYIKIA